MRQTDNESFGGGQSTERQIAPLEAKKPNICYGLGVIAADNGKGYVQAGRIEQYVPEPFGHDGLPVETFIYRQYSPGSPAAIDMRQKNERKFANWEQWQPQIVRGQE